MDANAPGSKLAVGLEQDYQEHVDRAITTRFRVVMLAGVVLFTGFSLLDRVQYPELAGRFLALRISVSLVLVSLFALSYWKRLRGHVVWLADAAILFAGATLCAMVLAADGADSDYYQGINLVFLAMFTVNAFKVVHNASVGLLLLLLYYAAVSWNPTPLDAGHLVEAFLFMGGTLCIVLMMTELYQLQHRGEFRKTEELARANARLVEAEAERIERVRAEAELAERKRSEQRLASLVAELEDANRELKDFASIVSHDLKAPLRAIGSLAHWISTDNREVLDEEGQEQLAQLVGRVQRMSDLIDGILDYSRLGRVRERRQQVDLGPLVAQVVEDLEAPPDVTISVPDRLPTLHCQKVRIQQLFQNLLGNAIKFRREADSRIELSCRPEGDLWHFTVRDNGPGIEKRHFDRIFQIFQTLAPRDEIEGTGVGLALAKRIVELHKGRVWVESRVGEGSCFHFTLPAAGGEGPRDAHRRPTK